MSSLLFYVSSAVVIAVLICLNVQAGRIPL